MANRETARDRGVRRADRIRTELARELHDARLAAGLSQEFVARASGIARSTLSLIERSAAPDIPLAHAAAIAATLGLDLTVKLFPAGLPLRDAGQQRLMGRFRAIVNSRFIWLHETGLAISGDYRAFDAVLRVGALRIGIEAETHVFDVQALLRRIALKKRDSNVDRIVLVLANTRHNREVVRAASRAFDEALPAKRRILVASLRDGRDPGADGYLFV